MKSVDLNENWNIIEGEDEYKCDLPYDALVHTPRDMSCAFGELNGYYPAARARFVKSLPQVKHGKASLVISGACGYGDVSLNGNRIGRLADYSPTAFDVTDKLTSAHNELALDITSAPGMSDKYAGLGIAGGVTLYVSETLDFEAHSIFVSSDAVGDKTYAVVNVTITNGGEAAKFVLECTALNMRGKRAGKKQRKIFLRSGVTKTYTVRVRLPKPYEWTTSDPYTYTMNARIVAENVERKISTRFGVVTRTLNGARGLYINGKNTELFGAYVSHSDAAVGSIGNYSNEVRRLSALKAIGYNAVHFVGCPVPAALDACDDVGLYAFVDLYPHLIDGKAPLDSHIFGSDIFAPELAVKTLRNHPSVTVYGIADDVPECYNRNNGHALIAAIADAVRAVDDTRPLTVSTHELVPTAKELEEAGVKKHGLDSERAAIHAAREKDVFGTLTEGAFEAVDVCGFNYLSAMYDTERQKRDRLIIGARTNTARAFESINATGKNGRVFGDFNECGIDYPGGAKQGELLNTLGDLDAICDEKPQAVYKRILLGERGIAYITVCDPETDEPMHLWNWPRHLGKPVTIKVYTSGDVVALYLDNRIIGRKLAGRINRHIATFTTEYYPGTLTAVAYYRGVECARTTLKSAASPKSVRLSTANKNLSISRGDLGFVHIDVCDRDGELVPYAMRELAATVTGGTLVGFVNADPMLRKNSFDSCPAFGGRALAVVKPDGSGKTVVKITGDGLLSSRISFKHKD